MVDDFVIRQETQCYCAASAGASKITECVGPLSVAWPLPSSLPFSGWSVKHNINWTYFHWLADWRDGCSSIIRMLLCIWNGSMVMVNPLINILILSRVFPDIIGELVDFECEFQFEIGNGLVDGLVLDFLDTQCREICRKLEKSLHLEEPWFLEDYSFNSSVRWPVQQR